MTTPREEVPMTTSEQTTSVAARTELPAGTWHVDPVHSRIGFAAKHLGIATVRGAFLEFEGTLDPHEGRAYGTVKAASLETNFAKRDDHLRSPDFFDVEEHPELRFESTEIRPLGEDTFEIEGDLTIRGVTNPIVLRAEFHGTETDPWGHERIALEVTGKLDRSDWGMTYNQVLGSGNMLVSDGVELQLDISAIKQVRP
jgi:polyisoprenoid-binding protein YceI